MKKEMLEGKNIGEKREAEDIKKWNILVEHGYEISIPGIVLDKLDVAEGDIIKFVEENKKVYLEKA